MNFTIENLIDLREAVTRRLQEISTADFNQSEMKKEQQRRQKSLSVSLGQIESEIKDFQFEEEKKPGHKVADDVYKCPRCSWQGFKKDLSVESLGERVNIEVCPVCLDHNVEKV